MSLSVKVLLSRVVTLATVAAALFSTSVSAERPLHLLGFVERLCPREPYCFDLRVKPEFIGRVGSHIRVRFATVKLYDPENFELTLQQQNIVVGSHLRLLIYADPGDAVSEYRAQFIWIGD